MLRCPASMITHGGYMAVRHCSAIGRFGKSGERKISDLYFYEGCFLFISFSILSILFLMGDNSFISRKLTSVFLLNSSLR